jgi:hypothetical protein
MTQTPRRTAGRLTLRLETRNNKRLLYDELSHNEITVSGITRDEMAEEVLSRFNAFEFGGAVEKARKVLTNTASLIHGKFCVNEAHCALCDDTRAALLELETVE